MSYEISPETEFQVLERLFAVENLWKAISQTCWVQKKRKEGEKIPFIIANKSKQFITKKSANELMAWNYLFFFLFWSPSSSNVGKRHYLWS